jgi:plastocyanin
MFVNLFTRCWPVARAAGKGFTAFTLEEAGAQMKTSAVLAGLAALAMACGGGEGEGAADTTSGVTPAPAPAATSGGATHDVNMVMEGTAYKFVPADLTIRVGDRVVFHNVSGGPHNVKFWADSIPAGAKEVIEPQLPDPIETLSSKLLVEPNETLTLSFANAPTGAYHYTCTPHMAMGMHAKLTVTP